MSIPWLLSIFFSLPIWCLWDVNHFLENLNTWFNSLRALEKLFLQIIENSSITVGLGEFFETLFKSSKRLIYFRNQVCRQSNCQHLPDNVAAFKFHLEHHLNLRLSIVLSKIFWIRKGSCLRRIDFCSFFIFLI